MCISVFVYVYVHALCVCECVYTCMGRCVHTCVFVCGMCMCTEKPKEDMMSTLSLFIFSPLTQELGRQAAAATHPCLHLPLALELHAYNSLTWFFRLVLGFELRSTYLFIKTALCLIYLSSPTLQNFEVHSIFFHVS